MSGGPEPAALSGDPAVGVVGLRTFRVSRDGVLVPLTTASDAWAGGTCVAVCTRRGCGSPPADGCTCGIHALRDLGDLRGEYAEARYLVAVVELSGQVVEGTRGYRAQLARVVALWLDPPRLPGRLRRRLLAGLPGVEPFDDVLAMLARYPALTAGRARTAAPPEHRAATVAARGAGLFAASVAAGVALFVLATVVTGAVPGPAGREARTVVARATDVLLGGTATTVLAVLLAGVGVLVGAAALVGRTWRPLRVGVWGAVALVAGVGLGRWIEGSGYLPSGAGTAWSPLWVLGCAAVLVALCGAAASRPAAPVLSALSPLVAPVRVRSRHRPA